MDLHLVLDRSGRGMTDRLADQLRTAVRTGRLAAGARLPASRVLAADLRVSRGVVVEAYARLTAEGLLDTSAGGGTRVARLAQVGISGAGPSPAGQRIQAGGQHHRPGHSPISLDLRAGTPDLACFPRARWLAASRTALASLPNSDFGYPDPAGHAGLRAELADYLARVRAAVADPRQIVIVSGVAQGLALISRVLAASGRAMVAVEDPCSPRIPPLLRAAGLDLAAIPVDGEGIDVDSLARSGARAALVTPAHQYPTGVVLSPARRSALTAWARDTGGLIIEDDYDAEFRYDRDPVGCVQGRAPEHVALAGSVSKTLAPSLRVGWVLAPEWLAAALADGRLITDLGSPVLTQATLAVFLAGGGYDQHVRAMRRLYRGRRDALVAALQRLAPALRLHGISAGLHLYAELPASHDEAAVVTAAARRGLAVEGVFGMRSGTARRQVHPALVLGYASLSDRGLREAAGLLAAALTDAR